MTATPYGTNVPGRSLPTGMAVTALVLGILGILTAFFLLGGLLGLIAVILGIVALGKAKRGEAGGRGLAIGGIVTGALAMLLTLLLVVAIGSFFAQNEDELNNLSDCLNNANTSQAERACREQFERSVNP